MVRIEANGCGTQDIGTGFLIGHRLVATVEHVVHGATAIKLVQRGVTVATGTVIGDDPARDLALVQTSKPISGHIFQFASAAPALGESVAALGFPLGLPLSVSQGAVSGTGRTIAIDGINRSQLIQTDAAVNPGNSGGPLLSLDDDQVVGLIDLGTTQANGIAFAVSGQVAHALLGAWEIAPQTLARTVCQTQPAPTATAPPSNSSRFAGAVGAVNAYWYDISIGSYADAYTWLGPGAISLTKAQFVASEQQAGIAGIRFDGTLLSGSGSSATVEVGTLVTDDAQYGCRSWTGTYAMTYQGGGWLIASSDITPHHCTG